MENYQQVGQIGRAALEHRLEAFGRGLEARCDGRQSCFKRPYVKAGG